MTGRSEDWVESVMRLEAARRLVPTMLYRNNSGALPDARGVPVRFGLGNESKEMNKLMKSADWIGWESIIITPEMVGTVVARFLSVECKHEHWHPRPNDEREQAQRRWADRVNAAGGRAIFVCGPGQLELGF